VDVIRRQLGSKRIGVPEYPEGITVIDHLVDERDDCATSA
jgi:hypothetical protein